MARSVPRSDAPPPNAYVVVATQPFHYAGGVGLPNQTVVLSPKAAARPLSLGQIVPAQSANPTDADIPAENEE